MKTVSRKGKQTDSRRGRSRSGLEKVDRADTGKTLFGPDSEAWSFANCFKTLGEADETLRKLEEMLMAPKQANKSTSKPRRTNPNSINISANEFKSLLEYSIARAKAELPPSIPDNPLVAAKMPSKDRVVILLKGIYAKGDDAAADFFESVANLLRPERPGKVARYRNPAYDTASVITRALATPLLDNTGKVTRPAATNAEISRHLDKDYGIIINEDTIGTIKKVHGLAPQKRGRPKGS